MKKIEQLTETGSRKKNEYKIKELVEKVNKIIDKLNEMENE